MKHKFLINKSMTIILTLMILLSIVAPAMAQEDKAAQGGKVSTVSAQVQGPTDATEMEAFMDDLFAKDMEEYNIPGAAVSVVKDGVLFFAKGYGYADLENKIPVDAEHTIFPTGSAGKLFTWTAVMQLAELGKLDLDADVNTYLDFRIPDTYPKPITLKHLMTHTAGFEDQWFEYFAWDADGVMPVGEWLSTHIPARVRPPGEVAAYSNYGGMLAGYIVARVSGQPFEQYIQDHIFEPLGMERSYANLILAPDLRAHTSKGYWSSDGASQAVPEQPDDYMGQTAMGPAGGFFGSVSDMARFMIAHLQGGYYGDASTEMRILEEATARQMHSTLYTPDPRIQGTAYGFFDFGDNGQRTIGHTGGTLGFTTMVLLLPDQNLGVYLVYNSESSGRLTTQHAGFQRAFFDHYYPAPVVEPIQPPADFAQRVDRYVGIYSPTLRHYTTFEKFVNLINPMYPPIEISDPADGTLLYSDRGIEMRLTEVEPLYFRQPDGSFGVVFREDDRGRITHMFADVAPQHAYEKLKWYETASFNVALLLVCILFFLSMIPVAVIRFIRSRRISHDQNPASRIANRIIVGISVLNLLFLVGTMLMFSGLGFPRFGVTLTDKITLGLGVLSALLTVGALVYGVLAWKDRYWSTAYRAYYTLVTIAAVAFVWFLNYWNLLGWRF
ncbi:MAG TPA: serine hydrolase [Anaerolineales bacterium]